MLTAMASKQRLKILTNFTIHEDSQQGKDIYRISPINILEKITWLF